MDYQDRYQSLEVEDKQASFDFVAQRLGFVRKVFAIISIQLCITTLFCIFSYAVPGVAQFQMQSLVIFYICLAICIICEISLFCCKSVSRTVPTNYIILVIFTFCESWIVSTICSIVEYQYSKNGAQLVLLAAIMTLAITLSLTAYAFTTKRDITMMGGSLFIFGMAIFCFGLFCLIFNSPILNLLYVGLATILYGFYLVYDIQLITGGKQHELDIDDYIVGALMVYIDIIQIFINLLSILSQLFGKD